MSYRGLADSSESFNGHTLDDAVVNLFSSWFGLSSAAYAAHIISITVIDSHIV